MWIVEFEGELYGPFASEDECFSFAARVSREPNDWTPAQLLDPEAAEGLGA